MKDGGIPDKFFVEQGLQFRQKHLLSVFGEHFRRIYKFACVCVYQRPVIKKQIANLFCIPNADTKKKFACVCVYQRPVIKKQIANLFYSTIKFFGNAVEVVT